MQKHWAYNGLDCLATRMVWDAIHPMLSPEQRATYAFERALQAPAMTMMLRGTRVDIAERAKAIGRCNRELDVVQRVVNALPVVQEVWDLTRKETGECPAEPGKKHKWPRGEPDETRKCERCGAARLQVKPFNPNSSDQCKHLFVDLHGLPPLQNKNHDESMDEEVIERIGRRWAKFKELTSHILKARGIAKQLGFLNSRLSDDNRFRQSVNVGGPETGRFSSSKNPYREGSNMQNIAEKSRAMFVPDPGWVLLYPDLEQAESRTVAYVAQDEEYIQAHLSGDVHTYVSRLLWPGLAWTGDLAADKKVAKETPCPFDPDHDYRYNAKRCQHGLNYGLTPKGLARWAHIPEAEARKVFEFYFKTFPGVWAWQQEQARLVRDVGVITTPLGRRRQFFGRPNDPHTVRQALAFTPQSMVADILNVALWVVWRDFDPERVQLLAQVHDAILCQAKVGDVEAIRLVADSMTIPVPIYGRVMTIPVEMQVGGNWGKRSEENLKGLEVWHENS